MTFILAYSGQKSITLIKTLFAGSGLLGTVITAALMIIIIVAMMKIDWEQIFEKHIDTKKVD